VLGCRRPHMPVSVVLCVCLLLCAPLLVLLPVLRASGQPQPPQVILVERVVCFGAWCVGVCLLLCGWSNRSTVTF